MAGQGNKERGKTTRESSPAFLEKVDIVSQEDKTRSVSVIGGTVRVLYWESLLADSVWASVTFTDAGNTLSTQKRGQGHGKRKKKVKERCIERCIERWIVRWIESCKERYI